MYLFIFRANKIFQLQKDTDIQIVVMQFLFFEYLILKKYTKTSWLLVNDAQQTQPTKTLREHRFSVGCDDWIFIEDLKYDIDITLIQLKRYVCFYALATNTSGKR